MSYIGIQHGGGKAGSTGAAQDALRYVSQNQDKIAEAGQFLVENRSKVFQNVSNAQRFFEKNWRKNPKDIRYLTEGEYHIPLMSYCGPGTNLTKYGNYPPYNEVDNACRTHDFAFREAFKLPIGSKERKEAIRVADEAAVKELDKYPGMYGQRLARTSLALKQRIEDINPDVIKNIVGEAYVGAAKAIEAESETPPASGKCKGRNRNRKKCRTQQTGGDALENAVAASGAIIIPAIAGALYGEYRLGKFMYDRLKRNDQVVEPIEP